MKYVFAILTLFVAFVLTACEEKIYDDSEFYGKWNCIEYIEMGESQKILPGEIVFDFMDDNTYFYKGGTYKEAGTWKIKGKILYTQAEGKLEKPVEIETKSENGMTFKMTDSGIPVKMILERAE
jgi:hypothetical protein